MVVKWLLRYWPHPADTGSMSFVHPFQFDPVCIDRENNEEITSNALENEEDQMDEEEGVGQISWCFFAAVACQCQLEERAFAAKSVTHIIIYTTQ